MDTTKDIVDEEENNNVDVATDDQPNVNNTNTSNTSSSGLQQIEDDDNTDMPLPMGLAEEISIRAEPPKQQIGKVEHVDDNDLGPEPPTAMTAMLEASLNAADPEIISKTSAAIANNLSSVNELNPPVPFDSTEFEDDGDAIAKKKAKDEMNQKPAAVSINELDIPSNRDSIYEPSSEVIEGGEGMSDNTNTGRGDTNRRGWEDIESRAARRDIESQTRTDNEDTMGSINNDSMAEANTVPTSTNQGLPEVEAYLVEDVEEEEVEVYMATPTLPWWKQRRTKILLGVVLVIVATLSIVLGLELSKDDAPDTVVNMIVNGTDAPSISLAPSSSMAPSSSPTRCVNKIISNAQEIDLIVDLQINDPHMPKVAIDGRNMVVVALDGKYYPTADKSVYWGQYYGPAFITFYLLDNNNERQRIQTPIRVNDVSNSVGWVMYSVSLSGSIAFIGFPYANDGAGDVLVYKQNQFDEWDRVDDPFIHTANTTENSFGSNIDVDGELACVGDNNGMNLYHGDDDSQWVQFDTIESGFGTSCSISRDTIAVTFWDFDRGSYILQLYKYNQGQNKVASIQNPISTGTIESMVLNNGYLVSLSYDEEESSAFVYHRDETNQTFILTQKLMPSGPLDNDILVVLQQLNITGDIINSIALDDDILVVGTYYHTHIYSLQDGNWVESITVDGSYDSYYLSGRTLVATVKNPSLGAALQVNGRLYDAVSFIGQQATISPVAGMLCDCGLGLSQCECQDKVCLIERGISLFLDKISNCESGGGLASVIYNNVDESLTPLLSGPTGIPAVYIDQENGKYLLANGIGTPVEIELAMSTMTMVYSFNIQDCTQDMPTQSPSLSPTSSPTLSTSPTSILTCFDEGEGGRNGVLYNAVRSYVSQDCANNKDCDIAQVYGWPMNSWCVGNVKHMSYLFYEMDTFNEDISDWDTSSVTTMNYIFFGASSFNGDVSNFETSSVTDMSYMFYGATAFSGRGISNFDTSSVTNMNGMFEEATSFNGDVSNFNTSSVTSMFRMFYGASLFNGDVSNFDTSSVTDMNGMFEVATSFNGDVTNFDTSIVTNMRNMFDGASSFNGDVSNFTTSSATSMWSMFQGAVSFDGDVSNFDTSSVTDMRSMFSGASSFNGNVSNFDTSKVTIMASMFSGATSFNGDVSNFDTSSVTNMYGLFWGASSFNGDVSNFETSSVTSMYAMFRSATSFSGRDVSNFDTSSVTNMEGLFSGATSFNGDVSTLNTSSVTSMYAMFWEATSFNGDLSNFDTSSVTDMQFMFSGASSFNGDVSNFNTSSATSMRSMFRGATSFNKDLCSWRDSFPYTNAAGIFTNSSCTYQDTPNETLKGPFCASNCNKVTM